MAGLYEKYGAKTLDPSALMQGTQNVTGSIRDALGSIRGLMSEQEQRYTEENTLNVQQYLKDKIQAGGLGGDPVDTTAIRQQFGSRINMDQIGETISSQRNLMEKDAVNIASQLASQSIDAGGDALASRQVFEKSMRDAGASEKLIGSGLQAYNDTNETKFQDMATLQMRETDTAIDEFDRRIKETGIGSASVVMESMLVDKSPTERRALKKAFEERVKTRQELTPNQQFAFDNNLSEYDSITEQQDIESNRIIAQLEGEQSALSARSAVPQGTYQQLDNATADFGDDVINAIDNELGWFNNNDVDRFDSMLLKLTDSGIPERDAAGMITHVFRRNYSGGAWHGNNVSESEIIAAEAQLDDMSANYNQSKALGSQISDARTEAALARVKRTTGRSALARNMRNVAQDKTIGHSDTTINDFWNKRIAQRTAGAAPAIGGKATPDVEPGDDDLDRYAKEFEKTQGLTPPTSAEVVPSDVTEFKEAVAKSGVDAVKAGEAALPLSAPKGAKTVAPTKSALSKAFEGVTGPDEYEHPSGRKPPVKSPGMSQQAYEGLLELLGFKLKSGAK